MNRHHVRNTCRACGQADLRVFLSLGPMPLANAFLRSPDEFADEPSYPLDVCFCEHCSLVQLKNVIDAEVLFRNYLYVTGTSDTIASHNTRYAQTLWDYAALRVGELVVEVASNDGSLLKCLKPYGVRTLGIEPATNIAALARANGIETVNVFFNSQTAKQIVESYGPAKVVVGNNVLAHVDETLDFLIGCRILLAADGVVVIEVPYLGNLLDHLEYDTVYHEHLCYFSLNVLMRMSEMAGLSIARVDFTPVHGGSIRIYARLKAYSQSHAREVTALASAEQQRGLTEFSHYEQFADQVQRNREALVALLESLNQQGKSVAGYGAPAKGNTLLNYCRIDARLLPYTVDKSPLKVGLYTPGMHIPVMPASTLLERQPDYVLLLAWNFADEIMRQQNAYYQRGGRFIIPIPEIKIV